MWLKVLALIVSINIAVPGIAMMQGDVCTASPSREICLKGYVQCLIINCREHLPLYNYHRGYVSGKKPREFVLVFKDIPMIASIDSVAEMLEYQLMTEDTEEKGQLVAGKGAPHAGQEPFEIPSMNQLQVECVGNNVTFITSVKDDFTTDQKGQTKFKPKQGGSIQRNFVPGEWAPWVSEATSGSYPKLIDDMWYSLSGPNEGEIMLGNTPISGLLSPTPSESVDFGFIEAKVTLPERVWQRYGGKERPDKTSLKVKAEEISGGMFSSGLYTSPLDDFRIQLLVKTASEDIKPELDAFVGDLKKIVEEIANADSSSHNSQYTSDELKKNIKGPLKKKIMEMMRKHHSDHSGGEDHLTKAVIAIYKFLQDYGIA